MQHDWQLLPEEICVEILTGLDLVDRYQAASACRRWYRSLCVGHLWNDVIVIFKEERDAKLELVAKHYGKYFKNLHIKCHQSAKNNRTNTCAFLEALVGQPTLRLENFTLEFCEENPLFYSGHLLLGTLKNFFLHPSFKQPLKQIDLSKFPVAFDDDLLNIITQNHADSLEQLNIQNKILMGRISAKCIAKFVSKASNLNTLHIPYSCFEGEALKQISETTKLKFLSLTFKRADKFFKCLSGDDWNSIRQAIPDLRIELHFDPTYPLQSTFRIMLPEVPVSSLKLYFQATVNEHINLASMIYKQTLRVLEVTSSPNAELDDAVLRVVKECESLESIHVRCKLSRNTVSEILKLKTLKHYTLSSCEE